RVLDGDGLAPRRAPAGQRGRPGPRRDGRLPRLPPLRAVVRTRRDVPFLHAPGPRDAERADGVPRRPRSRAARRARRRGALAQLPGVRPPRRPAPEPRRARRRTGDPAREPLLPDREPLPLQLEVLASLGAAVPRLRGAAGAAMGRARRLAPGRAAAET